MTDRYSPWSAFNAHRWSVSTRAGKRGTQRPNRGEKAGTPGATLARQVREVPPELALRADTKKARNGSGLSEFAVQKVRQRKSPEDQAVQTGTDRYPRPPARVGITNSILRIISSIAGSRSRPGLHPLLMQGDPVVQRLQTRASHCLCRPGPVQQTSRTAACSASAASVGARRAPSRTLAATRPASASPWQSTRAWYRRRSC